MNALLNTERYEPMYKDQEDLSKKSKKPEFLVKLYKMLQHEDPTVICWDNGENLRQHCSYSEPSLQWLTPFLRSFPSFLRSHKTFFYLSFPGRIHVRNPHLLSQRVLHKYFRHSKYR